MVAPHSIPPSTLDDRKRAVRRALRHATGDDAALRDLLLHHLRSFPARIAIGAVWPLPGEPDLRPLLEMLDAAGHAIALPVVAAPATPLLFRRWRPGMVLVDGVLGTRHPEGPEIDPDLLLVPLLAFDRACRRLGRGAGFYDRTLAARPGVAAVGFAHASREVDRVPADNFDIPLDTVVTDREIIRREPA